MILLSTGETVKTGKRGTVHAYPYITSNPTGPVRTAAQTRQFAKEASDLQTPVSKTYISISWIHF